MNILCSKCGKLVIELRDGKTRNGYVVFCSEKCYKPPKATKPLDPGVASLLNIFGMK